MWWITVIFFIFMVKKWEPNEGLIKWEGYNVWHVYSSIQSVDDNVIKIKCRDLWDCKRVIFLLVEGILWFGPHFSKGLVKTIDVWCVCRQRTIGLSVCARNDNSSVETNFKMQKRANKTFPTTLIAH